MPLAHLLYRCPRCGHEALEGRGDEALCPRCDTAYERAPSGRAIVVRAAGGASEVVPVAALVAAIRDHGGPLTSARRNDGSVSYSARATIRVATGEEPVRVAGRVLGFHERFGAERDGTLRASDDELVFTADDGGPPARWSYLDLRALQAASSTVQITPQAGPMVQFRFPADSPRRWEDLLRSLVAGAWREAGRGTVVEFQPRIVAT